eukprot:RCo007839
MNSSNGVMFPCEPHPRLDRLHVAGCVPAFHGTVPIRSAPRILGREARVRMRQQHPKKLSPLRSKQVRRKFSGGAQVNHLPPLPSASPHLLHMGSPVPAELPPVQRVPLSNDPHLQAFAEFLEHQRISTLLSTMDLREPAHPQRSEAIPDLRASMDVENSGEPPPIRHYFSATVPALPDPAVWAKQPALSSGFPPFPGFAPNSRAWAAPPALSPSFANAGDDEVVDQGSGAWTGEEEDEDADEGGEDEVAMLTYPEEDCPVGEGPLQSASVRVEPETSSEVTGKNLGKVENQEGEDLEKDEPGTLGEPCILSEEDAERKAEALAEALLQCEAQEECRRFHLISEESQCYVRLLRHSLCVPAPERDRSSEARRQQEAHRKEMLRAKLPAKLLVELEAQEWDARFDVGRDQAEAWRTLSSEIARLRREYSAREQLTGSP